MIGLIGIAQVLATLAYGIKGLRRGTSTWDWPYFHNDPQQENASQMNNGHSTKPQHGQCLPSPLPIATWPPERHPASRSATNSSLSVSKLHCQDCQRGRPTTGGPYMSISLVIDWSHCPCISLPPNKKKEGQEAIAHQTRSPQGKKKQKKRGQHGRPMTGLSYRAMRAACLFPPPSSLLLSCCWSRGGSFSLFGGSRLERCQSTSRHGTCCCYAQSSR